MKKYPQITNIILGAMARNGYTAKELSEVTGLPYATLMTQRFNDPGSWRFYEFGAVQRHIQFLPDEIEMIKDLMKGGDLRK